MLEKIKKIWYNKEKYSIWRNFMGKFDGILLCTDLDDTLLTTDKRVSEENRRAIEYFQSEGGLFTFATGRVPYGAKLMLEYVKPNAPMVCFNGAGIYDFENDRLLWKATLDKNAIDVVEFIDRQFPFTGIEVCTENEIFFCKLNRVVNDHQILEKLPDNFLDYHDVKDEWFKVLFMVEDYQLDSIREAIQNSPFKDKYSFVQSSPWYYELLSKTASKGLGLIKLAEILGINPENTIGMGDNDNDMSLVMMSGTGIAVANAIPTLRGVADYITVDNNSHAVAAVVDALERGKIIL